MKMRLPLAFLLFTKFSIEVLTSVKDIEKHEKYHTSHYFVSNFLRKACTTANPGRNRHGFYSFFFEMIL